MNNTDAIGFHDTIAAEFTRKYESSKAFQERFRIWKALFDRYINATDHVIDLGCGPGIFSNYLAGKGCTVIGIDGSATMIALSQQKKPSATVQYIVQSLPLETLTPYAPQDIVLMSSFLEYMDDMTGMLEQAWALLKPNGLLIVSMPNHRSLYRTIERTLFWLSKHPAYYAYIRHTATKESLNRKLLELSFDVCETGFFSGQDPVSRLLKPFLAAEYTNNLLVGVYRKKAFLCTESLQKTME
ncbi:methyltransferase domain-containing protein [Spirosoma sp. HMF3257]|uniref:Class I SAM-dependent methyltransferase n=2 Tax=Spirosoma telluris TaxID=2183553 RepID=A0A327NUS0_9BACT|nr:methyltransferase domain-containing protein [Spirosoma telluris]RAI78495.1 class I SAM-dependent methyltransferase [Spirosoma telluris]